MKRLTSNTIIDPLEFFRVSDEKLYHLLNWMVHDANALRRNGSLPRLESYIGDFKPMGVAAPQKHVGSPFSAKDWFLIHWPTVLSTVDTAFSLGRYSIVAILWHFREILYRRSVTFHDLLRRKISQHLVYRFFPLTEEEKAKRGYIDLDESEEDVFNALATGVINTPKTLEALRLSFRESLIPRGSLAKLREELFPRREVLGKIMSSAGDLDPNECSVFSYTALSRVWRQLECDRRIRNVSGGGFGPASLGDDFREVFFAFHFRRIDHGVVRLSKHVLAVNLLKFIPYRTRFTPYYRNIVGPKVFGKLGETAKTVRNYFETVFEPLIVHGAGLMHRHRIEALWGADSAEYIVYFSSDGIARRLVKASQMERVRSFKSKKSKRRPIPKTPRLFLMSSPPIPELGIDEMRFELIRRPSGVFWGVPWEMPQWTHYPPSTAPGIRLDLPPEDLPRKDTMRAGVTYVDAYDRYFYTLDMLLDLREMVDNPVRKSRTLREWMRHLSSMPARQFQLMQAGVRKALVVQQKRKPGQTLRGVTWTKEEDDAICQYYRPEMNLDDEAKLLRICRGRTARAVMRRASELREEMIKNGIYDLRRLPHRNYNASLRRTIKAAKDKAAAVVSAK